MSIRVNTNFYGSAAGLVFGIDVVAEWLAHPTGNPVVLGSAPLGRNLVCANASFRATEVAHSSVTVKVLMANPNGSLCPDTGSPSSA